MLITERYSLM